MALMACTGLCHLEPTPTTTTATAEQRKLSIDYNLDVSLLPPNVGANQYPVSDIYTLNIVFLLFSMSM